MAVTAVVGLLLWPLCFGDTLFFRDLYRQHLGTAQLIHSGGLSSGLLWDSLVNGGQPLLANPNRFLLYPSRLLYLILPPLAGLNWEIVVHFLLGGIGATVLARRLGIATPGASVAGIAFSVGGLSVSLSNHLGRFFAFHWLPWIVLAAHEGLATRGPNARRWRMALPLLLAIQWLTGAAEVAAMAALLVLVWSVAAADSRARLKTISLWVAVLVFAGVALAAIQVLPAAEMVMLSGRTEFSESEAFLTWSLHPLRGAEGLVPGFCGPVDVADPASQYWGADLVDFGFPYFVSLYVGASVLFLAGLGWFDSRLDPRWRTLRWVLLGLAAGGCFLACGRHIPLLGPMLGSMPGVNLLRFPVKALILAALPVVLLAGRGVDGLLRAEPARRRRLIGIAAAAAVGAAVAAVAIGLRFADGVLELVFGGGAPLAADGLVGPLVHTSLAGIGIAVCVAVVAAGKTRTGAVMTVAVVAADLLVAAVATLPMAPKEAFPTPPPLAEELGRHLGDGRFARDRDPTSVGVPLVGNRAWTVASWWFSVVDGAQGANWLLPMAYHSDAEILAQRRVAELANRVWDLDWRRRVRLFRMAGVEIVLTPGSCEYRELETLGVFPTAAPGLTYSLCRVRPPAAQAWWVAGERRVESTEKALAVVLGDDFDPTREVVRERGPAMTSVDLSGFRSEVWRGEVDAPETGVLVIAVPWHPDLVLEIDGEIVRAERLNYAFTGVPIERGRHPVRLIFASRSVFWGMVVSGATAILWIVFFAWPAVRSGLKRPA